MQKSFKYFPLLIGVAIAAGIFIGSKLNFGDTTEKIFATNSKKDKLNRLIDYIDFEYVDRINTDSIVDVTVNSILKNLDPHSVYIPVSDYESVADDMRGKFVGIGVSFYIYKDTVSVISTIDDGPAEKAGIKAGDRILFADDTPLFGEFSNRDSIVSSLRGELNSKVALTVFRSSEKKEIKFKLTRKEVAIKSVDAGFKINENLGYIKVNRFAETTDDEFRKSLKDLVNQDISTLILDLRNNPGGYVFAAERMLDELLPKGTLLLKTKNKAGVIENTIARRKGLFENGKVYVLVNENSASASEIVAGALQDNDQGIIVGRRTYGKGLVQREMALGDGSAIRLTVARYYTPTGRSIQRPYVNGDKTYFKDYQERYNNGELISADSISVNDSLRYVTPKGKVVYGGGGILPDVFIPKDLSEEGEIISYISQSGLLNYFVFEQLDKNRALFESYTPQDFFTNYEVTDELLDEFIFYSRLIETNFQFHGYEPLMKTYLKATIAQQLFGGDYYERILIQNDVMIDKILEMEIPEEIQNKDQ
ncbi:MAG: S41 family peptidase [Flavobacteriaceae bacterium]